jgi:hypothetical protein
MIRPLAACFIGFLCFAGVGDISAASPSPSPPFRWAARGGGNVNNDFGRGIAVDTNGNCYVTGYFQGTADFGTNIFTSRGFDDIFVAKYDADGRVLWARQAGGADFDEGYGIAADPAGNCYVTGYIQGNSSFGSTNLTSVNGSFDCFLAKYDTNGNLLWVRQAGGPEADFPYGIAADSAGNSYTTGYISATASFGTTNLVSAGDTDIFVAKYDTSGNLLWIRQAGGAGSDRGNGVAVDGAGNVFATGFFSDQAIFGTATLTNSGSGDIFVLKLDSAGNFAWARRAGGTLHDFGYGIGVDAVGNSYVTGNFQGEAFFGAMSFFSAGFFDLFAAKFDANGNLVWAKKAGGSSFDHGTAIAVDRAGNSFLTGYFHGEGGFGSTNLSGPLGHDYLAVKLDPDGTPLWGAQVGGDQDSVLGYGITLDRQGNSYVTGLFGGTTRFGDRALDDVGYGDVFVAKLGAAYEPLLAVSRSGSQLVFAWPTNALGFTLESASGLAETNVWTSLTNAPINTGGTNVLTIDAVGASRFYRLTKP